MKKKLKPWIKITIFSLIVTIICIIIWIILFRINISIGGEISYISNMDDKYLNEPKKEFLSILFAGVDVDGKRTDTIIYAKYDTVNNILYMMSVPRDTYTKNELAINKINSIYDGGRHTKELIEEVEKILDVDIDYYVIINLKLIPKIVNEIGGLEINLDKEIWKLNKKTKEWYFVFPKGKQTLNAKQVETLVRNRDYKDGDLSREKMQRKVITALLNNVKSTKNIFKLSSLLNIVVENTNTNITVREAMKYISEINEIDLESVMSSSMPIKQISYVVNGMDCVIINEKEAQRIIKEDWVYTMPKQIEESTNEKAE